MNYNAYPVIYKLITSSFFNGGKINFYNAQGEEISADTDMNKIAYIPSN